jgi:MinD superfamily P-loop ATPase
MKGRMVASTGGKGGTGKSTFAILLAIKLSNDGEKVVLCDCDVECPNDYLLLDEEILDPEPVYRELPELDEAKCEKCGLCSGVCKENAIFWIKEKFPMLFIELCSGCGACWIICPNDAIKPADELAGESFVNKVNRNLWLVTGRSKPGIAETGPIVREVKGRAIKLAEEVGADHLIVDTSPGTHCNVIQALLRCGKAYVVTEPTPLGAHDAGLIFELLQKMQIPAEMVLNKADVGDRKSVEKIARSFGVSITLEIPYSDELVRAYSQGRLEDMVDLI